ncbi:MAG: FliA/WhiG family RNA polymerase sigma factor [Fervidobacterium sp.]
MILDKDSVIKEYLPMVVKMARDLKVNLPHNVELDDLIQEGVVALLQAAERYDPRFGATFKTYVYKKIKGAMIEFLRKLDFLPKNVRQEIKRLDKELVDFYEKYKKFPTFEELAENMGLSVEEVKKIYDNLSLKQYLNIDQYLFDYDDNAYGPFEIQSDENVKEKVWKSLLYDQLIEAINNLSEKEKTILSLRFEYELSLREIAEILQVTESRVSQILTTVLAKLRNSLRGDLSE